MVLVAGGTWQVSHELSRGASWPGHPGYQFFLSLISKHYKLDQQPDIYYPTFIHIPQMSYPVHAC